MSPSWSNFYTWPQKVVYAFGSGSFGQERIADCISPYQIWTHWDIKMAVGQHQWYHLGVGAPPIFVYFSGDWDDRDFDPWPNVNVP